MAQVRHPTEAAKAGPDCPLCRLYHGRGPPSLGGPRSTANFLPRCVDVSLTTKKGRQLFGRRKVHPERKFWVRAWEKSPRLTLVWGPRMVNPALHQSIRALSMSFSATEVFWHSGALQIGLLLLLLLLLSGHTTITNFVHGCTWSLFNYHCLRITIKYPLNFCGNIDRTVGVFISGGVWV